MGGEGEVMNAAMVGGVVVGASLAAAIILCTSLCLALWCRRLRGDGGDPSPATFLVTKRKPGQEFVPDHPMALVLPTITQSEADSEPRTPTPTTTFSPPSEYAKRGVPPYAHVTRHNDPDTTSYPRLAGLVSPPSYSPLPAYPAQHARTMQRPRSASPRSLLPSTPRTPPLSLPLGARRWQSGTRPSSPLTPGTPPGLPSKSHLRKGVAGLEDFRAALHHSFVTSELVGGDGLEVSTPDSIEGWAPVWTPASSVGSAGGGCGLGEVRLRLRYTIRTRLLHLLIYSADQLPLRLGPDPVATYTKAVLLPEKRVRFTTPWVAATDTAVFNASFTHPTRPSRLAHATLRLSVCQVTGYGRRVVVGYCAVNLASIGMRSGLTTDIDTGLLALHLQETAPDQQVGVGGQLRMGLKWDTEAGVLTIRITCVSGLQLLHLQPPLQDNAQAYVKVTVYVNNTILCWRRSGPRAVAAVMELEEDLALHMPELDLDATHLVLSVRLRTRPGGGRRVVGSCLVGRGGCVAEDGRHHWEDMLRAAPDFVTRVHPLTAHHDPAAHPACCDPQEWRGTGSPHSYHHDHCGSDTTSSDYPTTFTSSAISNRPLILPTPRRALVISPDEGVFPSSSSTFLNSSSAPTLTTTTVSSPSALIDTSRTSASTPVPASSSTSLSSPSALTSLTSILSSPSEFPPPAVTFSSSSGFVSPSTPSSPSAFTSPSSVLNGHTVGSTSSTPPATPATPPRTPSPPAAVHVSVAPACSLSPEPSPLCTLSPAVHTNTRTSPDNTLPPLRHPDIHPPPPPPPSPSHLRPISQHRTL
ncbi:uncharacterized protein LOC123517671 isoform X3 [Portunus trituberculatus]|uniref:uncharacterized protein LOC123517671 isoform X3 n=1 Tax=Portunus trituberculatus TaxID=210409 RepID=UPI001E1D21A5|nr:uncharacterized protein LOC123517671 isoform X3 [Portunus trituberculatus]